MGVANGRELSGPRWRMKIALEVGAWCPDFNVFDPLQSTAICYKICWWLSRVWTFVVGAELAVRSQRRRTTVHDTHSCCRHCLVLEQTRGSWSGVWMKRATVLVIGGPSVVGSRSWGHTQHIYVCFRCRRMCREQRELQWVRRLHEFSRRLHVHLYDWVHRRWINLHRWCRRFVTNE